MWYAAGDKTNQALITSGIISLDFSIASVRASFISSISTNSGVSVANISFYYLTDNDAFVTRVRNGDIWALTWNGSIPTGEISGVSFVTEDAKKWLQFSADKTGVLSNNKDILTVSVTMLTANKSGTDTTFSGDLDVPVSIPGGGVKARFVFHAGKASKAFKFSTPGGFSIGSKMTTYRMDNSASVDVIL
jgi:hypothetical protein